MTQRIELVDKNVKTIIITIFYMFRKVEEDINMVSRDIEDNKDSNQTPAKCNI